MLPCRLAVAMHFGPPLAAKEVVSCTRILATLQRRPSATASSTPSDAGRRRCRHRRRCRPRHRRLKRRRRSCPSARSGPAAGTRSAMQQCQSPWHRLRRWVCERRKAVPMPCGMAMPTRCSNFGCSLRSLRRRRRRRRGAPQRRRRRQQRRRGRRWCGGGCGAEGATRRAAQHCTCCCGGGNCCKCSAARPAPTVALA